LRCTKQHCLKSAVPKLHVANWGYAPSQVVDGD